MQSFFQISESFFELVAIFRTILALGLCMRGGGGICAERTRSSFKVCALHSKGINTKSCLLMIVVKRQYCF